MLLYLALTCDDEVVVELLDTTGLTVEETGEHVAWWIEDRKAQNGQA